MVSVLPAGEFVRRGCTVVLYDHTEYTRTRAFQTLRASLWDHVANGYLLKQDVEELMGRIGVTHTLEETLERSELLIESVFEDAGLKRDLFNQMTDILKERAVPPDQITLCSNTMALPMQQIIEDIKCKEYRGSCVGMRFLHPVWFVDEVELTDCDYTRRATAEGTEKLLKQLFFQARSQRFHSARSACKRSDSDGRQATLRPPPRSLTHMPTRRPHAALLLRWMLPPQADAPGDIDIPVAPAIALPGADHLVAEAQLAEKIWLTGLASFARRAAHATRHAGHTRHAGRLTLPSGAARGGCRAVRGLLGGAALCPARPVRTHGDVCRVRRQGAPWPAADMRGVQAADREDPPRHPAAVGTCVPLSPFRSSRASWRRCGSGYSFLSPRHCCESCDA